MYDDNSKTLGFKRAHGDFSLSLSSHENDSYVIIVVVWEVG